MKVWKALIVLGIIGLILSSKSANANLYDDIQCHVDNIFYEANSEEFLGHVLVANSVTNRTATKNRWGSTVCGTVYQRLQYSWTRLPARALYDFKQTEIKGYTAIQENIVKILTHGPVKGYEGVNHYLRCDSRKPGGWWESMEYLGQGGAHCFYRD